MTASLDFVTGQVGGNSVSSNAFAFTTPSNTIPSDPTPGNLLLAFLELKSSSAMGGNPTPPTGWSLLGVIATNGTVAPRIAVYGHAAVTGDLRDRDASGNLYRWTWPNTSQAVSGTIAEFEGPFDFADLVDVYKQANNGSNSGSVVVPATTDAIDARADNLRLFVAAINGNQTFTGPTWSNGVVHLRAGSRMAVGYLPTDTTVAVSSTISHGGSQQSLGYQLVLNALDAGIDPPPTIDPIPDMAGVLTWGPYSLDPSAEITGSYDHVLWTYLGADEGVTIDETSVIPAVVNGEVPGEHLFQVEVWVDGGPHVTETMRLLISGPEGSASVFERWDEDTQVWLA